MDPKLWFWTGALANLALIVLCGARGLSAIRRRDARSHARMMLTATTLVGVFLVAYAAKLALLGREDRSAWTAWDYAVLYAHELCIAAMLAAGALALFRAWRFRAELGPDWIVPPDADALPGGERHRRAGRIAGWAGLFAFLTAIGVWLGMLRHAAW